MKAVILARVSTAEQEEGHSVDAQVDRLREYCQRRNLDVLQIFRIVESSTKGKRKDFHAMLEFVNSQRETVAVVADAVDRVQRSFKESIILQDLVDKQKIEIHFNREGMIIGKNASSSDIIRWDFSVVMAKSYVTSLSENVKRSIQHKLKNGEWASPAPLGYWNDYDSVKNKRTVIIDKERAFIIRQMFEDYATGTVSVQEVARRAHQWGLTNKKSGRLVAKSQVHNLLQNPFYAGFMRVNGNLYPHFYERIIPLELFERCEAVRLGHNKKPFRYGGKGFLFRGLLYCADCGCAFSTEIKKGKYRYLRPTKSQGKCECYTMREEVILEQVQEAFKTIRVPETLLAQIKGDLKRGFESEKAQQINAVSFIRKEYDLTKKKLDNALDMRLEGSITKEEYDEIASKLRLKQHQLNEKLQNQTSADESFAITVSALLDIASNAHDLFVSSEIEEKRQLMGFVFSNLKIRGKNLEYSMRRPFNMLVNTSNRQEWLHGLDSNQRPID